MLEYVEDLTFAGTSYGNTGSGSQTGVPAGAPDFVGNIPLTLARSPRVIFVTRVIFTVAVDVAINQQPWNLNFTASLWQEGYRLVEAPLTVEQSTQGQAALGNPPQQINLGGITLSPLPTPIDTSQPLYLGVEGLVSTAGLWSFLVYGQKQHAAGAFTRVTLVGSQEDG